MIFVLNLPPPSAAAAALSWCWDSSFFHLRLTIQIHQNAQTDSSHTQMSLLQETHHFCKLQLNKLHSSLVHSYAGNGCVVYILYIHTHHRFPFTFRRTAVINQQLMILMADMRGAAELFLLITFSDSPAHVCVCVNEILPVPKRPCFQLPFFPPCCQQCYFFFLYLISVCLWL